METPLALRCGIGSKKQNLLPTESEALWFQVLAYGRGLRFQELL